MGLFSKKECDVCKKKMALMEGYKCADGTICNDCKKKMSPLFTDYKNTTITQNQRSANIIVKKTHKESECLWQLKRW